MAAEMALLADGSEKSGRLWQNGRMAQSYDRLGPCLGSGGMGSVWAARVGDAAAGESSGCAGSWVALKAIPIDLRPGERDTGGLHSGLRECLSTFRDLSCVHVVRYERYWLEESGHLPPEIRQFCERGRSSSSQAAQPPKLPRVPLRRAATLEATPSESAAAHANSAEDGGGFSGLFALSAAEGIDREAPSVHSLRFCEPGGTGSWACGGLRSSNADGFGAFSMPYGGNSSYGRGRHDRTVSGGTCIGDISPAPPSPLGESCGFVWESASERDELTSSPRPAAALATPELPRRRHAEDVASRRGSTGTPVCAVLLIEMELMGPPPDGGPIAATEERSTLRTWLQRRGRTFSDAADVFGSLMLSVRHIHRKRIVHADLKPDNTFCVVERSSQRVAGVRIGDFGLAGENQLFRNYSYGVLRRPTALGGTPGYVAPEILSISDSVCACSEKVDIYACAVILLELLLPPFRTQMERAKCLEKCCEQKVLPDFICARLPKTRTLFLEMCERDPMMRLSAEEVCKRFEKEVRKELCRSSTQQTCSPSFTDQPQTSANAARRHSASERHPELPVQKGRAAPKDKSPARAPGSGVGHRKHANCRKGRRRS